MKRLLLVNSDLFAIVDDEDFEHLSRYKWKADVGKNWVRAYTHIGVKWTGMHRLILKPPEGMVVDHINGNSLDNRRCNLRVCTRSQNLLNRGRNKNNKSGYKGVVFHPFGKRIRRWKAQIRHNYRNIVIGYYLTPEEAAKAYNRKAKELWGEFAWLNPV